MVEIQAKRTYHEKYYDNGDGTFTLQSHIGHVHYKDENNEFQESDIQFEEQADRFVMTKHNYELEVAKDFSAPLLMRYRNKYEGANHVITYEPFALAWYNHQTNDLQIFRNQQSVQGVCNTEKNRIYYTNAFGNGVDFEITLKRSGFTKEIVISNKPNQFPIPPTAQHRLVALFKYSGSGLKVLRNEGEEWNKDTHLEGGDGFEIQEEINSLAKSFILPAYGVDSDGKQTSLRVMWTKRNNQLWQIKEIPLDKMQNATFPVRFDTTTTYYTTSSRDAMIYNGSSGTYTQARWDSAHDATSGTLAGGTYMTAGAVLRSTYLDIRRAFLSFDTSGIGSGFTITDASLFLTGFNAVSAKAGSDSNVYAVASTPANPASFAGGDYDQVGTTTFGSIAMPISVNTQYELVLNSSGLANIDPLGDSCFALRWGDDLNDSFPALGDFEPSFKTNEETGTTYDPYLEVTYIATPATDNAIFAFGGM